MTDRRFHAANARVAHESLRGEVDVPKFVRAEVARVTVPVADLCATPGGARDKQLLLGQPVSVLERHEGWAFVQDVVDDYVGYVPEGAVGEAARPTHRIAVPLAHVYSEPDIKAPETALLSFFSEVAVAGDEGEFHALEGGGYIAAPHLRPLNWRAGDAVDMAEMFLGTPYLWGGNSGLGIDCSGLVQMALYAAGRACPRDSDLQAEALGRELPQDAPPERGDLIFWAGHVGMMRDAETLIHANAFHMAVAHEPLQDAMVRIAAREFGPVTRRRRLGV